MATSKNSQKHELITNDREESVNNCFQQRSP